MSTYTREGRFTPININSDPSQQLNYVQQRMGLQAKGESIIRSQYQNLLDLELTHGANQEKLNNFFKDANEQINKSVSRDNSDYGNVQKALDIFKPLTESLEYRSVLLDNQYTKHYKQEIGKAQYYKNKQDKEGAIGSGYSDYNYTELVNNFNKFKSSGGSDIKSWGDKYTYKPYYDYTEEKRQKITEFMKLPDKHSQDTIDNNGITTTITYEGKSADQIQRYLEANLSAKAQDQMLLEGRVNSDDLDDNSYIKLLRGSHEKSIESINNRIAQLNILNKTKNIEQNKKEILNLEEQRRTYLKNITDLDDVNYRKNAIKNKQGTFSNYYMNNKIAAFAQANANDRVSSELGTNSAFVNALNRQADLWKFSQKFAQDQQQFEADQQYKYTALETSKYNTALKEGLIGLDGKPTSTNNNGLGTNQVLTTATITDENQQSTREQQEKELEGDINQVLQQTLPYVKGAFGDIQGNNPIEISQKYLANLVDLSNKLQSGDKETLDLLNSGEKTLTPQQKDKRNLLYVLQANEDKVMAYKAYTSQKKQVLQGAQQQVLQELKKSGITIEQANNLLNNEEYNKFKYSFTKKENINSYGSFKSLESLAESLVNNPELAEQFKQATKTGTLNKIGTILGTALVETPIGIYNHYFNNDNESVYKEQDKRIHQLDSQFNNIKNIGVQAQLQINEALNNSYFSTQKELTTYKPLDTESPQAKRDLSVFNNQLTKFLPYLGETEEDFNSTMVTKVVQDNKGATIYYQPSEMIEGKLVSTGDKEKAIKIESPLVAMGIDDHRDKLLLGTMTLSSTGETPVMVAKGQVPFQYKIGTSSGSKYSKNEMGDGKFVAKVTINDKVITVPQEFYRPSEVEAFMRETSNNTAQAVMKDLKYDLEKQNKAPLTSEQKEDLMRSGLFKEMFNIKLKEAFEKGKVFSTFGVSNPDYSDLENLFLKD